MQLIEVGELERLRQRQLKEYDPTINAMARAQLELEDILSNKKLTDEDKLALLSNAQQRFKKLKASIGPMVDGAVPTPQSIPIPAPSVDIDADSNALQDFIDKHPAVIRSNAAGQLVVHNRIIHGSSFDQIMEEALNGEKFTQPGFPEFMQGLKSLRAPRTVFKNESFLSAYDTLPTSSSLSLKSAPASEAEEDKPPPPSTVELTSKKAKKGKKQKGKGMAAPPPGKRPNMLFLYK